MTMSKFMKISAKGLVAGFILLMLCILQYEIESFAENITLSIYFERILLGLTAICLIFFVFLPLNKRNVLFVSSPLIFLILFVSINPEIQEILERERCLFEPGWCSNPEIRRLYEQNS